VLSVFRAKQAKRGIGAGNDRRKNCHQQFNIG
jgi:hypothetical protein